MIDMNLLNLANNLRVIIKINWILVSPPPYSCEIFKHVQLYPRAVCCAEHTGLIHTILSQQVYINLELNYCSLQKYLQDLKKNPTVNILPVL